MKRDVQQNIKVVSIILFILALNIGVAFKLDYGTYAIWTIIPFSGLIYFLHRVQTKKELTWKKKLLTFFFIFVIYGTIFFISFHVFMSWLDYRYGIDDPYLNMRLEDDGNTMTLRRYTFE